MAEGYRGASSRRFKVANEAVMHALKYSYIHRREKKRDFRKLWDFSYKRSFSSVWINLQ